MATGRAAITPTCSILALVFCSTSLFAEDLPETLLGTTQDEIKLTDASFSAAIDGGMEPIEQVSFLKQPDPISPQVTPFQVRSDAPQASQTLAASVFGNNRVNRTLISQTRRRRANKLTADVVLGSESRFRATTDTGNLISNSANTRGVTGKQRSAIITNPRIRGGNVGQLLASGSYWFPARPDLDTLLSKIDSRSISNAIVIKGPYAARYGPGFNFIDIELLEAPRYDDFETHGSTSLEYKTNGEQWYGRQTVWGGDEDWGFRVGYGHRTGSDYTAGNGDRYIASYKSRDLDVALGVDLDEDSHLDFSYLRLDQTDVEVVTQLLDIEYLVTDAYEVTYTLENQEHFDTLTFEAWHNATRSRGNANSPAKRAQIPFLEANDIPDNTITHASSTGFSLAVDWGEEDETQASVGVDMRYLKQAIDHFFIIRAIPANVFGNNSTDEANGPLPKAYSANPGVFFELSEPTTDNLTITTGGRLDLVESNAASTAFEADGLSGPGLLFGPNGQFPFVYNPQGNPVNIPDGMGGFIAVPGIPLDFEDIQGDFNQSFTLGSLYLTGEYELDDIWTASAGTAFAMRAPTMAEMYPFQLASTVLPQQTFSVLYGNPNLDAEKRLQFDAGISGEADQWSFSANGYFAWVYDYITYDNIDPPAFFYQYTNTDLAMLAGFDLSGSFEVQDYLTAFATMEYVEGRDLDRNSGGLFGLTGNSTRSELTDRDHEALPNIPPLEASVGFRIHDPNPTPKWGVEFSTRVVDNQDRVATSLNELTTPGFTTYDIRGFWQVNDGLSLVAGVENLTDKHYQEHLDPHGRVPVANFFNSASFGTVYRPGINFYFGSEYVY